MLELECLLSRWCDRRLGELTDVELRNFHESVLQLETMELYKYFIKRENDAIHTPWLDEIHARSD
jgi:succinate dehydrogenase flavin-adding protein (antitoxin of CptAB toxin-antitoxin module)